MTVRMRNAINPQHACHSADVLTPTERAVSRVIYQPPCRVKFIGAPCRVGTTWGDVPRIRNLLDQLRGK